MSRGLNRHHADRIKHNRLHYWGDEDGLDRRRLGIVSKTPHPCTCYICGNPRKYHKELTMQEKKASQEPTEY